MKRLLISFLIFAAFGIFAEVIFRAITNVAEQVYDGKAIDWTLRTKIYFWMIPIYGAAFFLFHLSYQKICALPLLVKVVIITACIFVVEYITGSLLQYAIGQCPWKYTRGWHLHGLIRLDYTPFWMLFAFLLIQLYGVVNRVANEFSLIEKN